MNEFYESYGIAKIDWETRLKIKELASSRGLTAGQFMTNAINQYAIQFSGKAPALSDQFLTNLSLCRLPAGLKDHSRNVPWHTIRIEDMDNSEELKKYSTSQLRTLVETYPGKLKYVYEYARRIYNTSVHNESVRTECLNRLQSLEKAYHGDSNVAVWYCAELVNHIILNHNIMNSRSYVDTLRKMLMDYEGEPSIALEYCYGLSSLHMNEVHLDRQRYCVKLLDQLQKNYRGNRTIAKWYCTSLLRQSKNESSSGEAIKYIKQLQAMNRFYPDNADISNALEEARTFYYDRFH